MKCLSFPDMNRIYGCASVEELRAQTAGAFRNSRLRMVVLDDDPTGIQTVHGCLLLTDWQPDNLREAMRHSEPFFYLLVNTRAMTETEAERVIWSAVNAVLDANEEFGYRLLFVSRSDSTLRGHFPMEPETIKSALECRGEPSPYPVYFIPAFFEAGRHTVNGVHYMRDGENLIPVSETEFARDNVFGYKNSVLTDYITEKTGGWMNAEQIASVSLADLRNYDPEELAERLESFGKKKYVAVDAWGYGDLYSFCLGLFRCIEGSHSPVVLRTSSSLPKAITGLPDKPLLGREITVKDGNPGLVIVGSHVKKSTVQLDRLLQADGVTGIELGVRDILDRPDELMPEIQVCIGKAFGAGLTPVIYTSRDEIRLDDAARHQTMGQRISDFLVRIVTQLDVRPSFLLAKGGITSHEIMTKGLGIRRAEVLGQILPGVPGIVTGKENRFPNLPYIIFPGNVGDEHAVRTAYEKLSGR